MALTFSLLMLHPPLLVGRLISSLKVFLGTYPLWGLGAQKLL